MLEEVVEAEGGHAPRVIEPATGKVTNLRRGAVVMGEGCIEPSTGVIESAQAFGGGEVDGKRGELGVDAGLAGVSPEAGGDAEAFGGVTTFEDGDRGEVPIGEVGEVDLDEPAVRGRPLEGSAGGSGERPRNCGGRAAEEGPEVVTGRGKCHSAWWHWAGEGRQIHL